MSATSQEVYALNDYEYRLRMAEAEAAQRGPFTGEEPPTVCSYAQAVTNEAEHALALLVRWAERRIEPESLVQLSRLATALLYGEPDEAKVVGRAVQAGRDALRDIAADDVRAIVIASERAARLALHHTPHTEPETALAGGW